MAHDTHAAAAPVKSGSHPTPPLLPPGALEVTDAEVADRLRWARRRGQPGWIWPEVEPAAWREGLVAIEEALRARLAGTRQLTLEVPVRSNPLALAVAAFTSGTGPLLGRWVEDGTLDTTPELGAALELHLAHGRRRWHRLEQTAAHAVDVLADLGMRPVVLKGLHTATAFFEEPGCRPSSDVDLAVTPAEWPRAVGALTSAGYTTLTRQGRVGKVEMLPSGESGSLHSVHLLHRDAPIRLDLHAGLDRAFFGSGTLRVGDLAPGETGPLPAIHPAARALRQPLLLATLAAHASEGLHNLTLIRLYELARVIRVDSAAGALDWDALLGRVGAHGLRFLFPSLELTGRLAGDSVPAEVRRRLRAEAPPIMRRTVDAIGPASAQRFDRLSLEERFMWASDPRELVGRLLDMAWPASAGSARDVGHIYVARFWRLVRGRVDLGE